MNIKLFKFILPKNHYDGIMYNFTVYTLNMCFTAGRALIKCGEVEKQLGGAEREYSQSSTISFIIPLRNFIEGDCRTIVVRQACDIIELQVHLYWSLKLRTDKDKVITTLTLHVGVLHILASLVLSIILLVLNKRHCFFISVFLNL